MGHCVSRCKLVVGLLYLGRLVLNGVKRPVVMCKVLSRFGVHFVSEIVKHVLKKTA